MKRILSAISLPLLALLFSFSLFSSPTFAQEDLWTQVKEVKLKAQTKDEVYSVLWNPDVAERLSWLTDDVLKRAAAGFPLDPIKTVDVTIRIYKWAGAHSCKDETDDRLFASEDEGTITYTKRRGPSIWASTFSYPGEDWDPCAANAKKVEKTNKFLKKK